MPANRESAHPVLAQHLVHADGKRTVGLRVFCERRQASVPVETCAQCPACLEIETPSGDTSGIVRCAAREESGLAARGARVGSAVKQGLLAVETQASGRQVVALFAESGARVVGVVGESGRVAGILHEAHFVSEILRFAGPRAVSPRSEEGVWSRIYESRADDLMSLPQAIVETSELRPALVQMAKKHSRYVLIVDADGFPLGLLSDVEALDAFRTHELGVRR